MHNRHCVDDEDIVQMYWNRDQAAINCTDNKYGSYLFGIAFNILGNKNDSEECNHDTYLSAWNSIPPQRPRTLKLYLSQIIRNFAIKVYEKNCAKKRVPSELTLSLDEIDCLCSSQSPEQERSAAEIGRLISEYVSGLDKRQRYAFTSRYYFAESIDRIAKDLGVSASAVYKELSKIRDGLKEHLERNGIYV